MDELPDDVLSEILFYIDDPSTILSCLCVSRRWMSILSSDSFWIHKCKFDKRVIPAKILEKASEAPDDRAIDFKKIWLKNPYGRNLIRNGRGQAGLVHWDFSPAAKWSFENDPFRDHKNETAFLSSRKDCRKTQTVDLWGSGIDPWVLNELKPAIIVSEWYRKSMSACNASAYLHAVQSNRDPVTKVLDVGRHTVAYSDCVSFKWVQGLSKIVDYPDNMRYIHFISSVQNVDKRESEKVGVFMTNASVTLDFGDSHADHSNT